MKKTNADAFLDFAILADTVLGDDDEDEEEDDDETRSILLAEAILNGPPNGESTN